MINKCIDYLAHTESDSADIKNLYYLYFADFDSSLFRNSILELKPFSDGMHYNGYVWNFLKSASVIREKTCLDILSDKKTSIMAFTDNHSVENAIDSALWPENRTVVIELSAAMLIENLFNLPEDIYVFDASYSWTIAFTHEYLDKNRRYCLYSLQK